MAVPPINQFAFPDHYPSLHTAAVYSSLALTLLTLTTILLTIGYLAKSGRLDSADLLQSSKDKRDQLKYLAILSVAVGLFGTVLETKRTLIYVGISGGDWDKTVGPLGEALIPFSLGLLSLIIGLICMLAVLWHSSRLIARKRD